MGNHTNISPNAIATRAGTSGGGSSATTSTLTSDIATDLAATTATLNGTITSEGGASSTITGFDYGLTTSYGSQATSTYSAGTGTFHEHITSLTASTEYHFRAKSYNSQGWGYGSDTTLTTSAAPAPQTGYVDPNGDVTVEWTNNQPTDPTTHYTRIDDGVRQPTAPTTSDYNSGYSTTQVEIFNMSTIANVTTVTNVTVWVYGFTKYSAYTQKVSIYMNGSWKDFVTSPILPSPGTWWSASFDGDWTQADLDNLQVKIMNNNAQWSGCSAIYAAVTYTQ